MKEKDVYLINTLKEQTPLSGSVKEKNNYKIVVYKEQGEGRVLSEAIL